MPAANPTSSGRELTAPDPEQMKPRAMRLLVVEYNYSAGTEAVNLGVIPEMVELVDCLVWALPESRSAFYRKAIPASDRLIYERLFWPPKARFLYRLDGMLRRMESIAPLKWITALKILARLRVLIRNAWLRRLIQKHRITHFFTTWIFSHKYVNLPVPIGAMIMDLNWQHFPENFPDTNRRTLDRLFSGWLNRADVVFPISDFTAKEMRAAFPRILARIEVVPHGARVLARASSGATPRQAVARRASFYYPASAFAHKDHTTLIHAALALFARGDDFDLIFTGWRTECFVSQTEHSDPLSESVRQLLSENAALIAGRIKCLGSVTWSEVAELYEEAHRIILPSRFEGFGLPLLEAIERGMRVICTDIPPFLEQIARYDYGKYAIVFPAGDGTSLVKHMSAALQAPENDSPLPDEIAARTQRWTWRDAAVAYVDALSKATAGAPRP
jgi:glycosyltransferase involved in cell wall biosynthesis